MLDNTALNSAGFLILTLASAFLLGMVLRHAASIRDFWQ
jgi:hypothetical protein